MITKGSKVRVTEELVKQSIYPRDKAYFEGIVLSVDSEGVAKVDTGNFLYDGSRDIRVVNVYWLEEVSGLNLSR